MTCAEFDRWLEEATVRNLDGAGHADSRALQRETTRALEHARDCARCADLWSAARSVERSLTADRNRAVATPPDFVASVMARVERREAALRQGAAVKPAAVLRSLGLLAADPVSAISGTIVLMIALAAVWRPTWFSGAATAIATLPSHWIRSAFVSEPTGAVGRAFESVSPVAWIGIGLAAAGLAFWGLVPLYRRLVRDIVLLAQGRRV
jgi:hypothetical protein